LAVQHVQLIEDGRQQTAPRTRVAGPPAVHQAAVLGLAVLRMVLGYRVMQQMTQAPRDERLRLRGAGP
jgi:hypothetical protein